MIFTDPSRSLSGLFFHCTTRRLLLDGQTHHTIDFPDTGKDHCHSAVQGTFPFSTTLIQEADLLMCSSPPFRMTLCGTLLTVLTGTGLQM